MATDTDQRAPRNLRAICTACRLGGDRVLATHASRYGDGHSFCDEHARSGDPPLSETDQSNEAMLQRAIRIPQERPRRGAPQGLSNE